MKRKRKSERGNDILEQERKKLCERFKAVLDKMKEQRKRDKYEILNKKQQIQAIYNTVKEREHQFKLDKYKWEQDKLKYSSKNFVKGFTYGFLGSLAIMYFAGCASVDVNNITKANPKLKQYSDTNIMGRKILSQKQYIERNLYENGIEEIIRNEMKNDTYFIKEKSHKFTPYPVVPKSTPGIYKPKDEI